MIELDKKFDFKSVDAKWVKIWEEKNYFHAEPNPKKKSYTIVIPPPNVTGILHMGHALNNTLQDIIIRYKRMKGFETLWMPGTDHAGIATQNVVEKELAKEKKSRHDIGREEMLKRLWAWKKQYGDTIINQLKRLGASCDWPRTRFTMDEGYSEAVKLVFVKLYEKGLIYKGEYIINWCPRCQTALSDEEAEHQDTQGQLYYFRYPLKDKPDDHVTIATTRPETMLGDTAVAVNPNDKRYKKFIGKDLVLPLVNREIKIIADELVDPEFGTGAVKVTPAHDPNDFQMGQRHKLEFINVMHPDGRINEHGGKFNGLDRFKARAAIVEELKEKGLLEKIDPHQHAVGHCYRCHTVVEPYLSKQWFVKMKPLAKEALKVVKNGQINPSAPIRVDSERSRRVKFYPERWTKVYLNWMEEIRDWCISRQIWWGHRIPVWYCGADCEPIVALTPPLKCPHCGSTQLKQDEDVLDTWFSSWLWPFATLDWPKENKDLKYFYPGAALFTASEIIFFWVARMIMAGLEFMGDIPFEAVYIHGTVRDAKGRKMSKSLGNAIDPLEIIEEYGADSLRYSLIINSGQDLFVSKEKFEIGRNFANKIWNAARLILMNVESIDGEMDLDKIPPVKKDDLPSLWILSRFYSTLEKVSAAVETYRYSEGEGLIHDFFWGNFCDWYLEIIKDRWTNRDVQQTALWVMANALKMIHPFMPFVTEEIWSKIFPGRDALCIQTWPAAQKKAVNSKHEEKMRLLIDTVTAIRNLRVEFNIKPGDKIPCDVASSKGNDLKLLKEYSGTIETLARCENVSVREELPQNKNAAKAVVDSVKIALPLGNLIDIQKEKERLAKQLEEQKRLSENLSSRLSNQEFRQRAPADVVEKETARLGDFQNRIKRLEQILGDLK